jgi:hypothetical protein
MHRVRSTLVGLTALAVLTAASTPPPSNANAPNVMQQHNELVVKAAPIGDTINGFSSVIAKFNLGPYAKNTGATNVTKINTATRGSPALLSACPENPCRRHLATSNASPPASSFVLSTLTLNPTRGSPAIACPENPCRNQLTAAIPNDPLTLKSNIAAATSNLLDTSKTNTVNGARAPTTANSLGGRIMPARQDGGIPNTASSTGEAKEASTAPCYSHCDGG